MSERERALQCASGLSGNDRDFFMRVWSTDPEIYRARIRAAGFEGLGRVLDAGCGFGQWSLPLAEANASVAAIDLSEVRVGTLAAVARELGIANLETRRSSVEETVFDDASFDGIFSYSVIYFTDFRRTLKEFARLLRPGGRLYLCTNGLGWYLHNLMTAHNSTPHFDAAAMAVETLENSLSFYATGRRDPERQLVMPSDVLKAELAAAGLDLIAVAPEGTYAVDGAEAGRSFYAGEYYGAEGVYEAIARKAR